MIHGHVHIIISRGSPRDSRRGSTDRECHSEQTASDLFRSSSTRDEREGSRLPLVAAGASSSLSDLPLLSYLITVT